MAPIRDDLEDVLLGCQAIQFVALQHRVFLQTFDRHELARPLLLGQKDLEPTVRRYGDVDTRKTGVLRI